MRHQIAAYAILVLAIAGCSGSRGTYEPYPKPKDPVATKISISGNSFVQYSTFGLFVCRHEDQAANPDNLEFVEHNVGYNNIKVLLSKSRNYHLMCFMVVFIAKSLILFTKL